MLSFNMTDNTVIIEIPILKIKNKKQWIFNAA